MKQSSDFPYFKKLTSLAVLLIISLVIWFLGPELIIAGHAPLAHYQQRFYIITLFFLVWFLKLTLFDMSPKKEIPLPKDNPETVKKLQALYGRFKGATYFLKKTSISKHGRNFRLCYFPWYLLIGPQGSGKTSLLTNANINFILAKQVKTNNPNLPPSSDACDWWVTRDLVLIDIPGTYVTTKEANTKYTISYSRLWHTLLSLINKYHGKNTLGGIVVALNLPELLGQQHNKKSEHTIFDLKQRIAELKEKFGPELPFYFVITKCDLLPGFLEYFSESSSDELSQAWGIPLPHLKENESEKLLDLLTHRFNALISRLNKQLISRLHHERNPLARPAIKDFPLQVERLKEALTNLLKALAGAKIDFHLHGIYLTSATQPPFEEQVPQLSTTTAQQQTSKFMRAPAIPSRAYFTKQLILQRLSDNTEQHVLLSHSPNLERRRRVIHVALAILITTATIFLYRDFLQNLKQTKSIQNGLAQYELAIQQVTQHGTPLAKALPLLDSLQDATNKSSPQLARALSFYADKSQQTAATVYDQALQVIVLPAIKNYLEKYIKTLGNNPQRLYPTLKAYLMLGDPQHLQVDFVVKILHQVLPNYLSQESCEDLMKHIKAAFNPTWQPLALNESVIATARKQLISLPPPELSFAILKNLNNNDSEKKIAVGTNVGNPPALVSKTGSTQILHLFTADGLQANLATQINIAANEMLQDNWVLGTNNLAIQNQLSAVALSEQVRRLYIMNYVDIWENLLTNITLFTPKNLAQTDALIADLSHDHSPLLQLLETLKQHTYFPEIVAASPTIQSLDLLLTHANHQQENGLYKILITLRELHTYLQSILNTQDSNKAAFLAAVKRMQNSEDPISKIRALAAEAPLPLKTWLTDIADNSWHYVLQAASQFIETAWQSNVISVYNTQILNRFPFTAGTTKQEVDLNNFTTFLSKQGILTQFYQNFLQPFVNESDKQWQWRSLDNQKLPFTATALIQLQAASQFQDIWFPRTGSKFVIPFTLQAVSLSKNIKNFNLTINGELVKHEQDMPPIPHSIVWPNAKNSHKTSIRIVTNKNRVINSTLNGDWAWFKLVHDNTQKVMANKKQLVVALNISGYKVKYFLFTHGNTNPFLPATFQQFRLPEKLIEPSEHS